MLPCLVPSWPQIMLIRISFRSRSDHVLDADHALDFLSYLALQACISFCRVSDKSGASLFLPCSHKMPLLIWGCANSGVFDTVCRAHA